MRLLALLVACVFDPALGDGDFACGAGGRCPSGYACAADGRCHRPPKDEFDLDAPVVPDLDAPADQEAPADLLTFDLSCGAAGQMCCAADTCAGAGCCAQALCIATGTNAAAAQVCLGGVVTDCGAPGRPCCEDNACASGGCCSGGMCAASGAPCLGGGSCTQGACGGCGGAGKPCCKGDANGGLGNDYCTQAHTACNPATKVCATCGGPGEICCEGNRCAAGGCCDHALGGCVTAGAPGGDGLSCVDGSGGGGTCGKMSQPACGMKVGCTGDYTRNVNDLCLACGAAGQPCCAGVSRGWCAAPFACNPTTNLCASCGGDGQVCCSAGKCPASTQHTCMNDVCH